MDPALAMGMPCRRRMIVRLGEVHQKHGETCPGFEELLEVFGTAGVHQVPGPTQAAPTKPAGTMPGADSALHGTCCGGHAHALRSAPLPRAAPLIMTMHTRARAPAAASSCCATMHTPWRTTLPCKSRGAQLIAAVCMRRVVDRWGSAVLLRRHKPRRATRRRTGGAHHGCSRVCCWRQQCEQAWGSHCRCPRPHAHPCHSCVVRQRKRQRRRDAP